MSNTLSKEEKLRILKSIETDQEFRYSLLGALGLTEILNRLDTHAKNQENILAEIKKIWEEVKELKEGQNKLWEEVKELKATQNEILKEIAKLWQAVGDLRKDVNELKETTKNMQKTLERLTLTVEDESKEVIAYRIANELNEKINLERIFIDDEEINIYGVTDDLFVIGEATVRLGVSLIDELERKIDKIKKNRPDLIRKKMIKVIYFDIATPDSIELARKKGIWLLTIKGDITQRIIHETS
ncbi:hypothetical protein Calag_0501 [Caldisphaera lagunensis DSM 15908]|uniref:DUF8196 domain-containing protein n=1 Tax=Caldisphaera lagunensis (strain DSM 15908 / JCM 11604 / ANMR 0165 / IC-154) TaxID=1056495 RepID=L0A8U1_CALLD|nr:hypothetical protein [Caldisphaera lagunensis]AFZ70266.1 hypothetical protein Calag_0501 [Caldisphaera lagunensis DSM 15908]